MTCKMNDLATTKPQKCGFKLSVVVGSAKIVKELTSNIFRITCSIKDHFVATEAQTLNACKMMWSNLKTVLFANEKLFPCSIDIKTRSQQKKAIVRSKTVANIAKLFFW